MTHPAPDTWNVSREWMAGELPWPLRDDAEFDTEEGNMPREFDAEGLGLVYAFSTAGHADPLTPEQFRDCIRGRIKSERARRFVTDVFAGLDGCDWLALIDNAGVPVREIASFVRGLPPEWVHWRMVQVLNGYTKSGQNTLPFELEKAAAGGAFVWLA